MADSTGAAQPPSKRKIVLAIDNSRASLFAVEFAAAHLVNVNDEVVLCSVISYEARRPQIFINFAINVTLLGAAVAPMRPLPAVVFLPSTCDLWLSLSVCGTTIAQPVFGGGTAPLVYGAAMVTNPALAIAAENDEAPSRHTALPAAPTLPLSSPPALPVGTRQLTQLAPPRPRRAARGARSGARGADADAAPRERAP